MHFYEQITYFFPQKKYFSFPQKNTFLSGQKEYFFFGKEKQYPYIFTFFLTLLILFFLLDRLNLQLFQYINKFKNIYILMEKKAVIL